MWKEELTKFGWLHILFIALAVIFFALGIYFGYLMQGEKNQRKRDLIASISGLFLLSTELFRDIYAICVRHVSLDLIPFQICSLPLFLLPLFFVFKKGFFKDCLVGHISFINLVAAIAYFVNPVAMLREKYIALSLQTALFHALLIGICAFVFVSYKEFEKKGIIDYIKGFGLFIVFSLVAVCANYITNSLNNEPVLNLFYLYPTFPATFPIIDDLVRPFVPYPVYYFTFLIAFFALGLVPYFLILGIDFIKRKLKGAK